MARLDDYTFVVTNLLTQQFVGFVKLASFYWDEIYNAPGAGLATARYDEPTTNAENFADWQNALWVVKDGEIKWGGIIGKTQRRGGTQVMSIPVHGFLEHFFGLHLQSAAGMTYGTVQRQSDIEWRNVDQFNVWKDWIDHAQSLTDGNIGIGVEWDALSGNEITMVYQSFTLKNIGKGLQELAARDNGLRFRQVYRWEDGVPRCNFKLSASHPATVQTPLLYHPEDEITETVVTMNALQLAGTSDRAESNDPGGTTEDIRITVAIHPDDWQQGTTQTIISRWHHAGDQRAWRFDILSNDMLRLEWSEDGTATSIQVDTDIAPSFVGSVLGLVRVHLDVDNGAGDYDITIEESTDNGVTWTSLLNPPADPHESTFSVTY